MVRARGDGTCDELDAPPRPRRGGNGLALDLEADHARHAAGRGAGEDGLDLALHGQDDRAAGDVVAAGDDVRVQAGRRREGAVLEDAQRVVRHVGQEVRVERPALPLRVALVNRDAHGGRTAAVEQKARRDALPLHRDTAVRVGDRAAGPRDARVRGRRVVRDDARAARERERGKEAASNGGARRRHRRTTGC